MQGITARLLGLTLGPSSLIALAFGAFYVTTRLSELDRGFDAEGQNAAQRLAASTEYLIAAQNPAFLDSVVRGALAPTEVVQAAIVHPNGAVRAMQSKPGFSPEDVSPTALRVFRAPIRDAGGGSLAGLSVQTTVAFAQVSLSVDSLAAVKRAVVINTASVAAVLLLITGLIATWQARRFAKPLMQLAATVRKLAAGDYNARATPIGTGEVQVLELGVNNMARSISENQRTLTEKVDAATAALKAQRDQASAASQAKSRFLAAASHDLRQPMHALGLFCTALERRVQDGEQRQLIGNIQTSLHAMEGLFESLLDLSRLDAGRVNANIEPVALDEVLSWIDLEYASAARDKGLRFRVRPSGLWAQTDITLLRRILMNLVANAIRYTSAGGVLIGVRNRGEIARVEVWDTGGGIDEASRSRIFEEFVQLPTGEREKTKGLGLGLAIAQRSAHLMGTSIAVASKPGQGSVFSIDLLTSRAPQTLPHFTGGTDPASLMGRRIMVIEDDVSGRQAFVTLLEQWGCEVRSCEAIAEARALVDDGWLPDVIVSDYRLRANETGPQAVRAVEEALDRTFPVVVVTGELDTDAVLEHNRAHAGWLTLKKPAQATALRSAILHVLREQR